MSDQPPIQGPSGDLQPLPTQQCPHCSNVTPTGSYCGVCGAHLGHPEPALASRRPHAFSANPEEPVFRLSVITSLFPHLSHRSSVPFRIGFGLLVALLVVFSATNLEAPVIALSALGVPLLFQLYIHEVDVYEDDHLRLAAETLLIGAALGFGWAFLGGHIVAHALQPTLGSNLGGFSVVKAAVFVPVVGQALMLVPLLLVLVLVPAFGSRRESLDGFALGAASALGFTFAAILTELANRLSAGLSPSRPFTSIFTEALIRGVTQPVLAAAATGLVGASIWVRRSERGTVGARGRWLTNPMLILGAVLVVQVGLGFADQARLADIPLLGIHLGATALILMALRVGLHHILLHEQHDVAIGPAITCPHCSHVVPLMPFCPTCGVARVATTKRQRRGVALTGGGAAAGAPSVAGTGPEAQGTGADEGAEAWAQPGWPTLSPGVVSPGFSGYAMDRTPAARSRRQHHSFLLGVFATGLAAITVALVLTAVFRQPDTTPVPRCHDGLCPGLTSPAGGVGGGALTGTALGDGLTGAALQSAQAAGAPEPSGFQTFSSSDGHFSVALVGSGLYSISLGGKSSSSIALDYKASTLNFGGKTVQLGGGEVQFAEISNISQGVTAQQIVNKIVSQNAPSANMAYPIPDPLIGEQPGYGAVYDVNVNSSSGTQVDFRLLVMAAVQNGVAVVVWADGPDDPSFPSLPLLDHPSFIDMDIAVAGLDIMINSVTWKTSTSLTP